MPNPPTYLAVGHVCKDLLAGGRITGGGTGLYAGLTAARLGVPTGLLTACATEDLALLEQARAAGVACTVLPSATTTTFRLEYQGEARQLYLFTPATRRRATTRPATAARLKVVSSTSLSQPLSSSSTTRAPPAAAAHAPPGALAPPAG